MRLIHARQGRPVAQIKANGLVSHRRVVGFQWRQYKIVEMAIY